ncbi:MAG: glucose-6-phosphate dehydrogenase assembly protein OpcA, partial [Acidobacteriaceae bacterium]|nr:glucose-6-phosphate dehydrogenase assembly protein OpcA [Acidobacteriaceae bacterium]
MSSALISPAQPEAILKGLGKLWTSLGEEEKQQGKPTVLRACAMTLIVATDEKDEGFFASQTISELMREHPSRGIVLAVSDNGAHEPEARVVAQCWKPFGKAQQICCEQIEIKAHSESWP